MIRPLAEAPEALPALAELMRAAWPDWYGSDGPGDAEADLRDRSRRSGLPFGIVAVSGGRVLGGAALAATSHGAEEGEGPWVVGLLVAPGAQRQGTGSLLVAACEAQARREGFPGVFATTAAAQGLLRRRGWEVLHRLPDGHDVLCKAL